MIILKSLILDHTQWIEATWVDQAQSAEVEIPAMGAEPARTEPGKVTETQVWCQSYHPTQIDDLRAKAAEYGTPLDEYEAMLSEWVASYLPPVPEPLTPEQLQAMVVQATQARLDDFARTRNYDGILSACTYADSSVPKFAAEGQYAVTARDATWAALYALLADVQAGARPAPASFDDVQPLLPVLEWPNETAPATPARVFAVE